MFIYMQENNWAVGRSGLIYHNCPVNGTETPKEYWVYIRKQKISLSQPPVEACAECLGIPSLNVQKMSRLVKAGNGTLETA